MRAAIVVSHVKRLSVIGEDLSAFLVDKVFPKIREMLMRGMHGELWWLRLFLYLRSGTRNGEFAILGMLVVDVERHAGLPAHKPSTRERWGWDKASEHKFLLK